MTDQASGVQRGSSTELKMRTDIEKLSCTYYYFRSDRRQRRYQRRHQFHYPCGRKVDVGGAALRRGALVEFKPVETADRSMEESSWEITTDGTDSTSSSQEKAEMRKRQAGFSLDLKIVEVSRWSNAAIRPSPAYDSMERMVARIHRCVSTGSDTSSEFVGKLQTYVTLKRSAREDNLILVTDEKTEALQQSVSMLFKERSDFISRLWSDPYSTALTGLGKVSNFLQDQVRAAMLDLNELGEDEQRQCIDSLRELQRRDEDAQFIEQQEPGDFEMITKVSLNYCWNFGRQFPPRPADVPRNEPLTLEEWTSYKNPDGSFSRVRDLKKCRIFRGAWKYLLGHYDWSSTTAELEEVDKRRKDDYYRMKVQWRTISKDQEKRFSEFRDRKSLIVYDPHRRLFKACLYSVPLDVAHTLSIGGQRSIYRLALHVVWVLWTDLPCKNFHLLVCVAILDMQSGIVMENKFGFVEILKHVNDLSMRIPLEETLKTAEGVFHQLAAVQDKPPSHICEIVGFQTHAAVTPMISPSTSSKPTPGMAQRKVD